LSPCRRGGGGKTETMPPEVILFRWQRGATRYGPRKSRQVVQPGGNPKSSKKEGRKKGQQQAWGKAITASMSNENNLHW